MSSFFLMTQIDKNIVLLLLFIEYQERYSLKLLQ